MSATLKLTHKAIGVEVRRGTYDVVVDGKRAGSVEMNDTIEIPVEPGRHTLQVRNGRNSSRTQTFDVAEGETRRLPMHRKEVFADLSRVLRRSQPGALAHTRLGGLPRRSAVGLPAWPTPDRARRRRAAAGSGRRGLTTHKPSERGLDRARLFEPREVPDAVDDLYPGAGNRSGGGNTCVVGRYWALRADHHTDWDADVRQRGFEFVGVRSRARRRRGSRPRRTSQSPSSVAPCPGRQNTPARTRGVTPARRQACPHLASLARRAPAPAACRLRESVHSSPLRTLQRLRHQRPRGDPPPGPRSDVRGRRRSDETAGDHPTNGQRRLPGSSRGDRALLWRRRSHDPPQTDPPSWMAPGRAAGTRRPGNRRRSRQQDCRGSRTTSPGHRGAAAPADRLPSPSQRGRPPGTATEISSRSTTATPFPLKTSPSVIAEPRRGRGNPLSQPYAKAEGWMCRSGRSGETGDPPFDASRRPSISATRVPRWGTRVAIYGRLNVTWVTPLGEDVASTS